MEELLDYEGLIYSIINKYPNRYDRDDLYQAGMIGLIDAYKHFNKEFDIKFSTYAYYYVIGEVNKYIRDSSSLKVSKNLIQLKRKILETREVMAQRLGRIPTDVELALYLEIDEALIQEALIATDEVESIDDNYNIFKTYDNTSPEVLDLRYEIEKLDSKDKALIMARYYEEMTQSETSDILGISQVQVSRKEAKILQKLRCRL